MSSPFLAEIRMFGFTYPPKGWAFCNGQLLSIQQNQALFSLLGTTFGGNGINTFQLPNMQGRTPLHPNSSAYPLGVIFGEPTHTLIMTEMPVHSHVPMGTTVAASTATMVANFPAQATQNPYSATPTAQVSLNTGTVPTQGGNQPHENMQPYLVLNFCIALVGIFPSRN